MGIFWVIDSFQEQPNYMISTSSLSNSMRTRPAATLFLSEPFCGVWLHKEGHRKYRNIQKPKFLGLGNQPQKYHIQLVGGFNNLEKYESQWEGLSHIFWKIEFMFQSTNQNIITSINGEKSPQSRIDSSDPMPSSHVHLHISNDQRWPRLSVEIVHGRICHHFNSREECANRDGLQQNHAHAAWRGFDMVLCPKNMKW